MNCQTCAMSVCSVVEHLCKFHQSYQDYNIQFWHWKSLTLFDKLFPTHHWKQDFHFRSIKKYNCINCKVDDVLTLNPTGLSFEQSYTIYTWPDSWLASNCFVTCLSSNQYTTLIRFVFVIPAALPEAVGLSAHFLYMLDFLLHLMSAYKTCIMKCNMCKM